MLNVPQEVVVELLVTANLVRGSNVPASRGPDCRDELDELVGPDRHPGLSRQAL